MSTKQYIIIVLIIVFSTLGAFYSGFFIKSFFVSQPKTINTSNSQLFRPNYIDEVIIVTKDIPHKTLILSAIRTFVNKDSNNYTIKAFYFDGDKWAKEITGGESKELDNVPKTSIVSDWTIKDDPSYMLKQSVSGVVDINNYKISFEIPIIYNEMGIRSSPKYTKFLSETDGAITVNGKTYDSHVLYSRIYSFNPPESLIFTNDLSGIKTEWLAFWDNEGNFYSIDETIIDNKKTLDNYKAHSLGVFKDSFGKIQKSFTLDLEKNGKGKYIVGIKEGIDRLVSVSKLNNVNKSVNGLDIWLTGQAEGEVITETGKTIKGFGVFEQISQ